MVVVVVVACEENPVYEPPLGNVGKQGGDAHGASNDWYHKGWYESGVVESAATWLAERALLQTPNQESSVCHLWTCDSHTSEGQSQELPPKKNWVRVLSGTPPRGPGFDPI